MALRPGEISRQAQLWLDQNASADLQKQMPIEKVRAYQRQLAQPAIDMVLSETGVKCSHTTIREIPCLVLTPPSVKSGRVILYAFGGGFTLGSPEEDSVISARLALYTGATVISPAYRLAPEHPFPAALDDMTAVATKLLDGSDRVAFAGESAGANLLLSVLHRLRNAEAPMPVAGALMSPAVDQGEWGDTLETDRDPTLLPERVLEVASVYAPKADLSDPEISPIYGRFDAAFPAVIVTTGTRDLFLSQSARLARVMREAGAEIDLRVWEGMWHVFEFYPELPEAKASIREQAAFLNARF